MNPERDRLSSVKPAAVVASALALLVALAAFAPSVRARTRRATAPPAAVEPVPPRSAPRIDSVRVAAIAPIEFEQRGQRVRCDRELHIHGAGFFGTSFGPLVELDGREAAAVVLENTGHVVVWLEAAQRGTTLVRVVNPDAAACEQAVEL